MDISGYQVIYLFGTSGFHNNMQLGIADIIIIRIYGNVNTVYKHHILVNFSNLDNFGKYDIWYFENDSYNIYRYYDFNFNYYLLQENDIYKD